MDRIRLLERAPVSVDDVRRADSLMAAGDTLNVPEDLRPQGAGQRTEQRQGPTDPTGAEMEEFLRNLPGYTLTEYDAGSAEFSAATRRLSLNAPENGNTQVRREGMVLTADSSIIYDEAAGRLRAEGDSVIMVPPGGGDEVAAKVLIFDMEEERGTAVGASAQYQEAGNWKIYGDLPYLSNQVAWGDHARFTSCEEEEPHYHFETDELKIVAGGGVLVARPVKLYFDDVPVAWLPFVAQSTAQGRASGILIPRFSINDIARTSSSYDRHLSNVGFYWAINDYMEASLAGGWFANNYTSLTGTYRYRWLRKFMDGNLNFRRFWRDEGGTELALDTRHQWRPDERTDLRISARYASSNSFVRENTFNPREVTQSIDSEAGVNRRFDWGSVALSANRRQYLSDDRVESTMPRVTLSLQPLTIFENTGSNPRWYNNWTWLGSTNFSRQVVDRPIIPDSVDITKGLLDQATNRAGINSSFNLGPVSWSQTFSFQEAITKEFPFDPDSLLPSGLRAEREAARSLNDDLRSQSLMAALQETQFRDLSRATIDWSTSIGYQQRLIGTTTLTPRLAISGNLLRDDESAVTEAQEGFVAAPMRLNFGASLKTDIYGFWPGFTRYEAVRHKFTPTFDYTYSPAVTPTELQQEVFGSREADPVNTLRFGLNQTFEAKVRPEEGDTAQAADAVQPSDGSPRRLQRAQTVTLLAIRSSAFTYDFTRASEEGDWTRGFQENLTISNQISSDFLRGLNFSIEHDIFDGGEEAGGLNFDPHLSRANFSFSLGSRSGIFQWLSRVTGGAPDPDGPLRPEDETGARLDEEMEFLDPIQSPEEATMIPGTGNSSFAGNAGANRRGTTGSSGVGQWNANLSYSLVRPRNPALESQQMIQANVRFKPTEKWDVAWQTSYDVTKGGFNDHILRLSRDLHRWEAAFDFRQTATGNWTFRFEVSLIDNRELKFDYKQQDMVDGLTR
jgi:hypothetical protein